MTDEPMITTIAQFDQARAELVDVLDQLRKLSAWVSPLAEFGFETFRLGFATTAEAERVARLVARAWCLRFYLCRVSIPGAVFRDPELSDAAESFLTPGVVLVLRDSDGEPLTPSDALFAQTRRVRLRALRELERRSAHAEVFEPMLRTWADGGEAAARALAAEWDSDDDEPIGPFNLAEDAIRIAAQDWIGHTVARANAITEAWLERQGYSAAG